MVFLIWVVGAVCALAGAFSIPNWASNFPSSGGEYVYLTQPWARLGLHDPLVVSFFAGFLIPGRRRCIRIFRLSSATSFPHSNWKRPGLPGSGAWEFKLGWPQAAACAVVAVFTILNCLGVRRAARVKNALTSLKVLVLIVFIAADSSWRRGLGKLRPPAVRTSTTPLFSQFIISLFIMRRTADEKRHLCRRRIKAQPARCRYRSPGERHSSRCSMSR